MRRKLSIVLIVSMMFTMFAGIAFSAEKTNKQRLGEVGIIIGGTDGQSLDDTSWKREDVVVLLTRLYDKTELEMKTTAKTHTFTDVSNAYYDGFISWMVGENLVNGRSDTIFGFGDFISAQEFATLLLRVIGVSFEFEDAVKTAVDLGVLTKLQPNNSEVSRNASYDGIVNTLNTKNETGVTLGERLGLKSWGQPKDSDSDNSPNPGSDSDGSEIIEVTFEEDFFFGAPFEEIKEDAKLMGIDEVILNANRSVTYRMTKKKHTELLNEMKEDVYNWIDETVKHMDSVSKMTINDDFTELKVSANESEFKRKADQVQFMGISFQIIPIQMFDLVHADKVKFKIFFINEDTGVTFDTMELENNF